MEAKNFRIGNLVEEPKGCTHKIERVDELSKRVRHGLEITVPHLLAFGFEKDDSGMLYMELPNQIDGKLILYYADLLNVVYLYDEESGTDIQSYRYIHQVQNIFFAISGEELEMKIERSTCG